MRRRHSIVLNALIAVLALVSALLRFLDGELLFSTILLLLAVLNTVALILNHSAKPFEFLEKALNHMTFFD